MMMVVKMMIDQSKALIMICDDNDYNEDHVIDNTIDDDKWLW